MSVTSSDHLNGNKSEAKRIADIEAYQYHKRSRRQARQKKTIARHARLSPTVYRDYESIHDILGHVDLYWSYIHTTPVHS